MNFHLSVRDLLKGITKNIMNTKNQALSKLMLNFKKEHLWESNPWT